MVEVTKEGMLILCERAKSYYNLQLVEIRKEILKLTIQKQLEGAIPPKDESLGILAHNL